MKRFWWITLLALFITAIPLQAQDITYEEFYDQVVEYFSSFADENSGLTTFPTLMVPMGGNLEGMGTAFTAVANDSGFIDANPSASSSLKHRELSFLHHAWIADSNIDGFIYTFRIKDLGLGIGTKFLYLPFTEYNPWGEEGDSVYISETVAAFNVSYNFLADYNFHGIALGINFKAAYKNVPENIYAGQSALGVMADVGFLTRFNFLKFFNSNDKNLSVGAAFKNVGFEVKNEPLPTLLTAGIAYTFIRPVTLAVDFNLPVSFDQVNFPAARWYFAGGLNIAFASFLSLQTGIRIKENPMISMGFSLDLNDVSFIANYNLDLSGSLNPLDKFSVEAKVKLDYKAKAALSKKIKELFSKGLQAYANGQYSRAIEYWEEVVKLDPKYGNVQKYIENTRKAMALQDTLEEKQKLDE